MLYLINVQPQVQWLEYCLELYRQKLGSLILMATVENRTLFALTVLETEMCLSETVQLCMSVGIKMLLRW